MCWAVGDETIGTRGGTGSTIGAPVEAGRKRQKVQYDGGRGGDVKARASFMKPKAKSTTACPINSGPNRICKAHTSLVHAEGGEVVSVSGGAGGSQQQCKELPLDGVEQDLHAVVEAVDAFFVGEQKAVRKRQDVGRYRRRQDP